MFSIGLTGGIGSGKSQVANYLAELGAGIVDTDVIAHQLTKPGGAAISAIRQVFGMQAIAEDGSMDRNWMRSHVFNNDDARRRLQDILHPLIGQTALDLAQDIKADYCVFVVPLLVESGRWQDRVDRICVVDCPEAVQIERVVQRSGLTPHDIKRIMSTQATRQERMELADDIIVNDNSTSLYDLRQQTLALHRKWCDLSR